MLEFLTNDNWLNPQFDYLMYLQNLRMHIGPVFDEFFMWISKFGEIEIPILVVCLIYWCFDFKSGIYLFSLNGLGLFVAQFFKMSACVYRPWILNDKIKPVEAAFRFAGGYSFPSGHSQLAASSWGGMAFLLAKKHKILSVLIILGVLLVGFSRNYLGVHTLQDVVFGLSIGFVLIFLVNALINWCEKSKDRYILFASIVNVLVALFVLYVLLKDYPMDYVNGKLLVNPDKAISNSIIYAGWISGVINGICLCARFFPYDAKSASRKTRAIRGVIGMILGLGILPLVQYTFDADMGHVISFALMFAVGFVITAVYPLIFTKVEGLCRK